MGATRCQGTPLRGSAQKFPKLADLEKSMYSGWLAVEEGEKCLAWEDKATYPRTDQTINPDDFEYDWVPQCKKGTETLIMKVKRSSQFQLCMQDWPSLRQDNRGNPIPYPWVVEKCKDIATVELSLVKRLKCCQCAGTRNVEQCERFSALKIQKNWKNMHQRKLAAERIQKNWHIFRGNKHFEAIQNFEVPSAVAAVKKKKVKKKNKKKKFKMKKGDEY